MALGTQSLSSQGVSYGFDVWVKGQWPQTHDDTTTSNLGLACVSGDYKNNWSLLVGPYMATRLYKYQSFDGRLAWEKPEKNISPFVSYIDKFEPICWLARTTLTGDFSHHAWHLAPQVSVLVLESQHKAYTDRLNVRMPGL